MAFRDFIGGRWLFREFVNKVSRDFERWRSCCEWESWEVSRATCYPIGWLRLILKFISCRIWSILMSLRRDVAKPLGLSSDSLISDPEEFNSEEFSDDDLTSCFFYPKVAVLKVFFLTISKFLDDIWTLFLCTSALSLSIRWSITDSIRWDDETFSSSNTTSILFTLSWSWTYRICGSSYINFSMVDSSLNLLWFLLCMVCNFMLLYLEDNTSSESSEPQFDMISEF